MPQIKDLTGRRFGYLIVLEHAGKTKHGNAQWLCRCDCGKEAVVAGGHLTSGHTVSCGCRKRSTRPTLTHGESKSRLAILLMIKATLATAAGASRFARSGIRATKRSGIGHLPMGTMKVPPMVNVRLTAKTTIKTIPRKIAAGRMKPYRQTTADQTALLSTRGEK